MDNACFVISGRFIEKRRASAGLHDSFLTRVYIQALSFTASIYIIVDH